MTIKQSGLLEMITQRARQGMSVKQLVDHFAAAGGDRSEIRHHLRPVLKKLVSDGRLVIGRGKRYFAVEATEFVTGRVQVSAAGYGIVRPSGEGLPVRIEKSGLRGAMDRDRVQVRLELARERARRENQREGVVVRVLERARTTVVGRWVVEGRGRPFVRPVDRRLGARVVVSGSEIDAVPANGDFVVVAVERVSVQGKVRGRLVERLGRVDDAGVIDTVVLRSFSISRAFPDDALREADALPADISKNDLKGRWDLRGQPTVTIDPATARDFDDAVFAKPGRRGAILVDVHIADVGAYVTEDSPLDRAARERSTSVYLPNHVVPMLPERLSSDLCSLKPEVDRLAFTVRYEVMPDGKLGSSKASPSIIKSRRRFAYENVADWMESRAWPSEIAQTGEIGEISDSLWLCAEAADRLNHDRKANGGLDFDLAEGKLVFDKNGVVEDVRPAARTRAHRMIEALMIGANRCVAEMLLKAEEAALHRVHDVPDPRRLADLAATVEGLGLQPKWQSEDIAVNHLQGLLDEVRGKPSEQLVSTLVLRSLARAVYAPQARGHFALATDSYCHFTSPIRRYPDVIAHRALRRAVGTAEKGAHVDMAALGVHCSEREQRAESAERMAVKWRIVNFLSNRLGEEFDGRVQGVTSFGMFVGIERFAVDGLVHLADLVDDYYEFDRASHSLIGTGGRRFRLGDAIRVRLASVDEEAMQLQLLPADMRPDSHAAKKFGGKRNKNKAPDHRRPTGRRRRSKGKKR